MQMLGSIEQDGKRIVDGR